MTQKAPTPSSPPAPLRTAAGSAGSSGSESHTSTDLVTEAKHALVDVAGLAADQASDKVTSTKERAADGLGNVVQALRGASEGLGDGGQMVRGYVDQAADQVDRLTTYVRDRELGDIVKDVERMARREPALFVGGAFVLGIFAARFLKSSAPSTGQANTQRSPQQSQQSQQGRSSHPGGRPQIRRQAAQGARTS